MNAQAKAREGWSMKERSVLGSVGCSQPSSLKQAKSGGCETQANLCQEQRGDCSDKADNGGGACVLR